MGYKRISIDTSKHVFAIHGVDEAERPTLRLELRRSQIEAFFARLAPTEVALEACGGAHHWGRQLSAMGHQVKLIPPQYVKPFIKRNKNDRHDAEAIGEAASRPSMPTVAVKTVDEQAATMIAKHRELLVGQRTAAINALRGHAAEFGVIAAKGTAKIEALLVVLTSEPGIPAARKSDVRGNGRAYCRSRCEAHRRRETTSRAAQAQSGKSAARSDPWRGADYRDNHGIVGEPGELRERPTFRRLVGSDTSRAIYRWQATPGADQ